jgi:hypothetical protein
MESFKTKMKEKRHEEGISAVVQQTGEMGSVRINIRMWAYRRTSPNAFPVEVSKQGLHRLAAF